MAELTRELVQASAQARCSVRTTVHHADGTEYRSGRRVAIGRRCIELVSEALGEEVTPDTDWSDLRKLADAHDVELQPEAGGRARSSLELFEKLVEHTLDASRRSCATTRSKHAR